MGLLPNLSHLSLTTMDDAASRETASLVKIFFPLLKNEDDWPPGDVESLWAKPVEEGFQLVNIPMFALLIAYGDIVAAELVGGRLEYQRVVKRSGHGTVRIVPDDPNYLPRIKEDILELGCNYESCDEPLMVAMDIPAMQDYTRVIIFLESSFKGNRFDYEEALIWWPDPYAK